MADSSSNLQIMVSLVDEASAAMDEMSANLQDAMDQMASNADEAGAQAAQGMNALPEALGTAASDVATIGGQIDSTLTEAGGQWDETVTNATAAMAQAFMASMDAIDTDAATTSAAAATSIMDNLGGLGSKIGAAIMSGGQILGDVAKPINNFVDTSVQAASTVQQSGDQIQVAWTNVKNNISSTPSTGVTDLQDKIKNLQAELTKTEEAHTKVAGGAAKNAAQAKVLSDEITTYKGKLAEMVGGQDVAKESTSQLVTSNEKFAQSNTNMGFTVSDTQTALASLALATQDPVTQMKALQDAMDLSRNKGMDLQSATKAVEMAMQGQGRQLVSIIPALKNGASGMDALNTISKSIGGSSTEYVNTFAGSWDVLSAKVDAFQSGAGKPLLDQLAQLFNAVGNFIDKISAWIDKHQELTKQVMEFLAIFGLIVGVISSIIIALSPLILLFMVFGVAVGTTMVIAIGYAIAVIALIVAAIVIWMDYHKQITDFINESCENIAKWIEGMWINIEKYWNDGLTKIKDGWSDAWNWISNLVQTVWGGIENFVKGGINDLIKGINVLITGLDSLKINIPAIGVGPMKTPAVNWSLDIPNIPLLAAGGIINSPTMAIVGEAGPEAVIPLSQLGANGAGGAGATQIIININGGIFPADQNSINQIGQMLADSIGRKLKLRTT